MDRKEPHRQAGVNLVVEQKAQLDKFKQAARDLECDDDEKRFDERLKRLVKHTPVEKAVEGEQ